MTNIDKIIRSAIEPAAALLPSYMDTPAARVCQVAFGLQESRLIDRFQVVQGKPGAKGPARGLWQFERAGGTLGVLLHKASAIHAGRVCKARGVDPSSHAVWERLESDDVLAAAFARLLIYTDPITLPMVTDEESAWRLYLRTWRPGAHERGTDAQKKELRAKFARNHAAARIAVTGGK